MTTFSPPWPLATRNCVVSEKASRQSFVGVKTLASRPISTTTEIQDDTDFESDDDPENESPRFSLHSAGRRSESTLSSFEEIATPRSNKFKDYDFLLEITERKPTETLQPRLSVEGPKGPHLFRASELSPDLNEDFYLTMSPITPKLQGVPDEPYTTTQTSPPTPPVCHRPLSTMTSVLESLDKNEVSKWNPRQVARWMYASNFEPTIVEKFEANDISGAILVTLKWEDLKELDIPSLGKRHELWNEIEQLRGQRAASPAAPTVIECDSSDNERERRKRNRVQRRRHKQGIDDVISPIDSISFVGFEQLMPKAHQCGKGENCSRWRKQQRLIHAFQNEHPISPTVGSFMVAGNPGNPLTAESIRPFSDMDSSVVASSDVLGPGTPGFRLLDADTLAQVKSRDVQDNVREFLAFQHVENTWPDVPESPLTPPYDMFPSMSQQPQTMAQRARQDPRALPKLQIPKTTVPSVYQAPSATDRTTFSPGPMERVSPISPRLRNSHSQRRMKSPTIVPPHRFGTPASMSDVPYMINRLSSLPAPSRDASQSVPPDMNYRPQVKIQRTQSRSSRKSSLGLQVLPALSEAAVESPRTAVAPATPHQRSCSNDTWELFSPLDGKPKDPFGPNHQGWMKKRKTKLLRHEWHEHHFTLKGTKLSMHKDERCSEVLESIDVDDYAVACSSMASHSKLSAAMKAIGISSSKDRTGTFSSGDASAFSFQLIPEAIEQGRKFKKMTAGAKMEGKTHHFAVRSRDERIDWMRELMLAKALKMKEEGNEVIINGNMM